MSYLTDEDKKMLDDTQAFVVMDDGTYAPIGKCHIVRIRNEDVIEAVNRADSLAYGFADEIIWTKYVVDSMTDIETAYRTQLNFERGQDYISEKEPW
jgi:hypothetical protein